MASSPTRPASKADFLFVVTGRANDDLKVTAFSGEEGLSQLYRFRLELISDDPDIPFDEVVGKGCLLEIHGAAGVRNVRGIVRSFARTGESVRTTRYVAEVVPLHWLLARRVRSRIFQEHNCPDMTVPGIIKKVLTDAGIPADHFRFATNGKYDKREYVVQYRESEWDFISRLMETEGIFCFFEHTAAKHALVIADNPAAHLVTPNTAKVAFRERTGMVTEQNQEFLHRLRDRQEIQIGTVVLDDFNFQTPQTDLMAKKAADVFTSLEYSDYPGAYGDKAVGERYAEIRLQEFQASKRVQEMEGGIRTLIPGYKFTLIEHPSEPRNREYLVTHITHNARQPQSGEEEATGEKGIEYHAVINTIPATVPYRPQRLTPRPRVQGTQTAVVVGPAGEEIYTDKYGRVKVQFHWDREGSYNENSSRWIRVSQGMAGGQYGMMFLPRVGQEVVVDFLEGDPDEPVVVGRVYNNDLMPPYPLPDEKTKSCIKTHTTKGGGGCNEIRFEDLKGKEQLFIQAQRQMDTRVKASHFHTCGGNYELKVGGEKDGELYGEYRQLVYKLKQTHVKEDVRTQIDRDESHKVNGNVSIGIGGTKSTCVGGDVVDMFDSNHKEEVTATYSLKAENIKLEATAEIELKCGGSSIVITPGAIFITGGPTVNINTGAGAAVSAVTSKATETTEPEDARPADSSKPGRDVFPKGGPTPTPPIVPPDDPPGPPDEPPEPPTETTFVEISLVDEFGDPVPSERCEIILPNGRKITRTTNAQGLIRVAGIAPPGSCQVNFVDIDAAAWERI